MHLQDISNDKGHEQKQSVVHDLNERVKELTALHHTARLLQDDQRAPELLLQELVRILPAAFDQPDLAAARIVFGRRRRGGNTSDLLSGSLLHRSGVPIPGVEKTTQNN